VEGFAASCFCQVVGIAVLEVSTVHVHHLPGGSTCQSTCSISSLQSQRESDRIHPNTKPVKLDPLLARTSLPMLPIQSVCSPGQSESQQTIAPALTRIGQTPLRDQMDRNPVVQEKSKNFRVLLEQNPANDSEVRMNEKLGVF
jgi:hypothetical protein